MYRKSAYFLFVAVLGLLVIGIVMLFSTSAFARDSHGDAYFFLKRQSLWLGVGLAVCIAAALIDYHFWQRTWWLWLGVAAVTLVFCFVPHIGMRVNGSRRWIGFGPFSFQPSEIAKLAAVFFLAWWFARYEKAANHPLFGFAIPLAIVTALLALILFEVDLGTTALIGATTFVVMFVAGTNPILLGLLAITGGSVIFVAATHSRMERLIAFTDLERYKEDAGLQQMQALIAWGSG
ncbi:MAG: FtsW/RodA/SpoVE family cell cycle protein, partial [Verrucomicrobiota bacterium]|nr:FtsW/RodA/SpoVE family cell cycle protein [Verrucomicrobiota bacterium]